MRSGDPSTRAPVTTLRLDRRSRAATRAADRSRAAALASSNCSSLVGCAGSVGPAGGAAGLDGPTFGLRNECESAARAARPPPFLWPGMMISDQCDDDDDRPSLRYGVSAI